MSFAVIKIGGKQYSVESGDTLRVATIDSKEGSKIELEAIAVGDGKKTDFGGAKIKATIVSHGRDDKIIVFKKKRRKQYKRKYGHRQGYTEIKIDKI